MPWANGNNTMAQKPYLNPGLSSNRGFVTAETNNEYKANSLHINSVNTLRVISINTVKIVYAKAKLVCIFYGFLQHHFKYSIDSS